MRRQSLSTAGSSGCSRRSAGCGPGRRAARSPSPSSPASSDAARPRDARGGGRRTSTRRAVAASYALVVGFVGAALALVGSRRDRGRFPADPPTPHRRPWWVPRQSRWTRRRSLVLLLPLLTAALVALVRSAADGGAPGDRARDEVRGHGGHDALVYGSTWVTDPAMPTLSGRSTWCRWCIMQMTGDGGQRHALPARVADELGYSLATGWPSTNMPAVAATNPPLLLIARSLAAGATQRIRVGSGGVMLPCSPAAGGRRAVRAAGGGVPGPDRHGLRPGHRPADRYALRQGAGGEDPVAEYPGTSTTSVC